MRNRGSTLFNVRCGVWLLASFAVGCVGGDPGDLASDEATEVIDGDSGAATRLDAARLGLAHLTGQSGVIDGVDEIAVERVDLDEYDMAHVRVRQSVAGVPVFGGEAIVHLDADGAVRSVTDAFVRHAAVDTAPTLDGERAAQLALIDAGPRHARIAATPDLFVLRHDGADHLVYRVRLEGQGPSGEPSLPVLFIDAHSGREVWRYDDLQTIRNRHTHDAGNTYTVGVLRRLETTPPVGDVPVDQAHDHAAIAYDYYYNVHGRDSFNGAGAIILSTAHVGVGYVNAAWNGGMQLLYYGDGDGVTSGPLTVRDVVFHEFTHAVTQFTAGLVYANESGALNEGSSDIMAAVIEAYHDGGVNADTWKVGEDCWTPGIAGDALRYMNDPTIDGSSRDHYSERYQGGADNGGVHWNSGIANLFFYLLTQGGSHPDPQHQLRVVNGLGIDRAAAIWYRALTQYMTSGTTFAAARTATENACADLYSAAECASVRAAWCEVGVGNDCAPTCQGACGGQSADGCWCDAACTANGDCCPDYAALCPAPAGDSCEGFCGAQAPAGCYCDPGCVQYGDCCGDFAEMCAPEPPAGSCVGYCFGQSPDGCYCDASCEQSGDCCADYAQVCAP